MKILNRKDFIELPAEVVFAYYKPMVFDRLSIRGSSSETDFYVQDIVDAVDCDSSDEFVDKVDACEKGESISLAFNSVSRDGMYEDEQLFAVWERADVERLIARLQETLDNYPIL